MEETINQLFDQLRSLDVTERRLATEKLTAQDVNLQPWATTIVQAAGDADDQVRAWAADTLETLGSPKLGDLPGLMQLLTISQEGEILYWAATLIGRLGPTAHRATEILTNTVRLSPYLPVRERAVWALGRIGPRAKSASSLLREVSAKGPPRLRRLATEALESLRGMAA
jgi:HEAT repeat protein